MVQWYGTSISKHTWTRSHPWSASPTWTIPQFLLGVRLSTLGWRWIKVHPQTGNFVCCVVMHVLILRGPIALSLARPSDTAFMLNLTIPSNTWGEVCLLTALLLRGAAVTLNDEEVQTLRPVDRAGQLCLADELGGGVYAIIAQ